MSDQADKKVQLTAYAKVDATHRWPKRHSGIPVLVRVVAQPGIGDRAPIDLVAVLDVSCRALTPENRQSMLEEAMRVVIGKLDDKDRLAIVPVQTSTTAEQTGLMEMSSEGRSNAFERVKSLAVIGDNKLAKALANAAKILEERPEDQKSRVTFVILISDGDDDSFIEAGKIKLNCSVHTFGFRDAHNVRAMHHIAESHTGTYGILNDEHDRISEDFEASISKITSVVAVQTEVRIACSESSKATLSAIESGRSKCHIVDDRKRGNIIVGTLQAGAVRNFIVYVDKVGEDEHDDLPRQLTVRFMYYPALSRAQEGVGGQVVVVRHGVDRSKEVAAEIVRLEAVNIVGDILRKCDDKGRAVVDAADELWEQWLRLKDSEYGREAGEACLISRLASEMQEMEASMRRCSGLSYMLSWQSCHTLQHQTRSVSTSLAAKGSQQAQTPAQLSLPQKGMACRAALDFLSPSAHAKAGANNREYTDSETIERRSVSSFETGKKVQLSAYAKVDAIHRWPKRHSGIPVLVRVVAPPGIGDRAPIDLVAVLDVSCAALTPENRQSMLEEAMRVVIGKLDDKDRLAIVPVQTSTLFEQTELMEMSSEGRSNAFAKVKSLAVIGDNKLTKALANAATILEERPEDQKGRVSFVILISDGDDASIIEGGKINLNCSVHTFGFRDAHNVRAMHHIAESHTGTYGILNDEHDRITEAFEASISKITSVVAVQTEIHIAFSESSKATLSAIESGRSKWHIVDDRKRGKILVGTLQAGAVRNFIVYVDKVGEDEHDDLPSQLTVQFMYHPALSRVQEFVREQVVVVRQGVDRSKEVAAEIVRVEAVNIVGNILRKYDDKGRALVDAADELWEQWLRLRDSEYGREAGEACLISGLAAEMREMEASMRRSSGLSYMLSWQTCHTLQHQTPGSRRAAKGSLQAQTPAQLSLPPKGMAAGAHAKVVGYCLCFSFLPLFLLWFCLRFVRIEF